MIILPIWSFRFVIKFTPFLRFGYEKRTADFSVALLILYVFLF